MSIRPRRSLENPALKRPSALASVPRSPDYLWLDKNENVDPELATVLQRVCGELPPIALGTYPEAGELYRKLAAWLQVDANSLLLTPGSDGAIRLTFEAFVEHGDAVVHTSPTFAMYPVYSQMFGADEVVIDYKPGVDGPAIEVASILDAIRDRRPKLLCIPNPDSPTGTVLSPDVLGEILAACENAGTVLLLDEAYHPFYDWTAVPWTAQSPNLIVARTFAKAWGAAGLRIGYAVAHPETIRLLHKMRPMYEVSTFAVDFMAGMLDRVDDMRKSVERITAGKQYFVGEMRSLGYRVLPTHGNFVHVEFGAKAAAIHAALAKRVLYRRDFDHPSLAGFSRFTVAPMPVMAELAGLIRQSS